MSAWHDPSEMERRRIGTAPSGVARSGPKSHQPRSSCGCCDPDRIRRILLALNAAKAPEHMNIPGFRFHPLRGRDRGRYAVDASGNWRITFGWDSEDAVDVDLEDYH